MAELVGAATRVGAGGTATVSAVGSGTDVPDHLTCTVDHALRRTR